MVPSLGHLEEAMRPCRTGGPPDRRAARGRADLLAADESIVGRLSLPLVPAADRRCGGEGSRRPVRSTRMCSDRTAWLSSSCTRVWIGDHASDRHLPQGHGVLGAVLAQRGRSGWNRIATTPLVRLPRGILQWTVRGVPCGVETWSLWPVVPDRVPRRGSFTNKDVDLVEALAATATSPSRRERYRVRRVAVAEASSIATRELLSGTGPRPGRT